MSTLKSPKSLHIQQKGSRTDHFVPGRWVGRHGGHLQPSGMSWKIAASDSGEFGLVFEVLVSGLRDAYH